MQVEKENLMRVMRELRALFRSLGFDVTPYSAQALIETVLAVCPGVDDQWPRKVVRHLDEAVRLR